MYENIIIFLIYNLFNIYNQQKQHRTLIPTKIQNTKKRPNNGRFKEFIHGKINLQ